MPGSNGSAEGAAAPPVDPRPRRNALLLLHLTVFIWGWTGVIGKWVDQSALQIVYIRCVIACIGLFVVAIWMRRSLSPRTPDLGRYLLTGLIILAHWSTFYLAIKVGSASVAVACLSTSTFFTAMITPYWTKQRVSGFELALGVIIIVALLIGVAAFFGYRSYKADQEKALTEQRLADERAAAEQKRLEAERHAAAATEARRLADLKAQQDLETAQKNLAELRREQEAAEAARKAAEADAARLTAERDRLTREREAAQGEAKRIAEQREREAAEAERARLDALQKLQEAEQQKRELADREAARLAALQRQQELAAQQKREYLSRAIYPNDYKRREHYYMQIDLYNSEQDALPAKPTPLK